MRIKLTSVHVDDQEKALRFYTEVLGFVKKADFSQGPYRWPARGHVFYRRCAGRLRTDESVRRRVHHAANGRDGLQDRDAEGHLRQSHPSHAIAALRIGHIPSSHSVMVAGGMT
jgi:catechol 2,3-dioxygenase-like lactoylglutathione lyase family enzyme